MIAIEKAFEVCKKCGWIWNISLKKVIGKEGYICPYCHNKSKRLGHEGIAAMGRGIKKGQAGSDILEIKRKKNES